MGGGADHPVPNGGGAGREAWCGGKDATPPNADHQQVLTKTALPVQLNDQLLLIPKLQLRFLSFHLDDGRLSRRSRLAAGTPS